MHFVPKFVILLPQKYFLLPPKFWLPPKTFVLATCLKLPNRLSAVARDWAELVWIWLADTAVKFLEDKSSNLEVKNTLKVVVFFLRHLKKW